MQAKSFLITLLTLAILSLVKAQDSLPTVKIGDQIWMVKNLDVVTFRNGDTIPEVKSDSTWIKAGKEGTPAWCYYKNDPKNGAKFGKLYNWYAVNDARGLAPKGFHIASENEWNILIKQMGGYSLAGPKLKSKEGWFENKNGTDDVGFSGVPGGRRSGKGSFEVKGSAGFWWSSSEDNNQEARYYAFYFYDDINSYISNKGICYSVRCLRD